MRIRRSVPAALLAVLLVPHAGTQPADPPPDPVAALLREVVPDDGPVRPPYELARQDMGLRPGPDKEERNESTLRHGAVLRQERMERTWSASKRDRAPHPDTAERRAAQVLLAYAFGETPLDAASDAAREAGRPALLRLARLLLAECRYDGAVRTLVDLAAVDDAAGRQALGLLVRHAEERKALAREVPLVPLAIDLDDYLERRASDPVLADLIGGFQGATRVRMPSDVPREEDPVEVEADVRPSELAIRDDDVSFFRSTRSPQLVPGSLTRAFLQTAPPALSLRLKGDSLVEEEAATLVLRSAFGGEMTFRLYRFADKDSWQKVDAPALAGLEPERTWRQTYEPLRSNNRAEPRDVDVTVDGLAEGYYLLTCEARYAPVLAGQKFCVSRVALYVRAIRDRVVAAAVDRHDGRLLPDLPVALAIRGTPCVDALAQEADPGCRHAFRAGFLGEAIPDVNPSDSHGPAPAAETAAPGTDLALAQAYAAGAALRRRYPDLEINDSGRTGKDGCAEWPVDIGRPDYAYDVSARRTGPGLAEARVAYREHPASDGVRVVVWTAQPLYRPGGTVQFKGIVRRFDGRRVADHDAAWKASVHVTIRQAGFTLWEGDRPLSPAGAFDGGFPLPTGAPLGDYEILVDGESASPYCPFRIEEFRLPTFRVQLAMDRHQYQGGETASGTVTVRYVHGEPVADAQVEVVLETGETDPPARFLATDANGTARVDFLLPQTPATRRATLRASVMDASGETYTASTGVTVAVNSFRLEASVTPSPAARDSRVDLAVSALRWDGTPVVGAAVVVDGETRAAVTDAKGLARLSLRTAEKESSQTFRVFAVSGIEAVQTTVHLALRDRVPGTIREADGEPAHRDHLALQNTPTRIRAGEPIHLEFDLDHAEGKPCGVLLFVENDRLLAHRALSLPPGRHELTIDTEADWAPSAEVTLVAFTGRRPLYDSRDIYLNPVDRFLTIEVAPDRDAYKPGDPCQVALRAVDHEGRPVSAAEISLGVVNTALYALRDDPTPDLARYFHEYRLPHYALGRYDTPSPHCPPLCLWQGPKYAWGCLSHPLGGRRTLVSRGGGSGDRYGGRAGGIGEIPLRSRFLTQAHWVADLVTDADGRARSTFTFPDDVTEWIFTARGITPDTRVGSVVVRRRTLLPLQVEVSIPRALRAGDAVAARAVVHNNDGGDRTVDFSAFGTGKTASEIVVAKGKTAFLEFPLAPGDLREHQAGASVLDRATGEGDRIARAVPVLQRGHRVTRTHAGTVKDGGWFDLDAGGGSVPESRRLTVAVEAGLAGPIASALDRLIGYPYGCVEQTMSRFMPAVVAARAMREARIDHPRAAELDAVFEQGISRLAGHQHADGGWGWWKADETNGFMTAYVLEGLARCRDAGRRVPAGLMDRAERYLAERLIRSGLTGHTVWSIGEVDRRTYAAHALALYYAVEPERFETQRKRLVEVLPLLAPDAPVRDAALLADTQRLLGLREEARDALDDLAERFQPDGKRGSVLATATLLELGAALEPGAARWVGLAHQLVSWRRGPAWTDTLTTAAAVRGLSAVLSGQADEPGPVEVLVDGRVVKTIVPRSHQAVTETIPLADAERRAEIRPAGAKAAGFWSARVETYLETPPAPPPAPVALVACRVHRTQPERAALAPDAAGVLHVRRGETLEIELDCEIIRPLACLRVSLPRPCGVEMTAPPRLQDGLVAIEVRDDGLHVFVDNWAAGRHFVRFKVRAEAAGRVFAPLPELEPMYGDPVPVKASGPVAWIVEPDPAR